MWKMVFRFVISMSVNSRKDKDMKLKTRIALILFALGFKPKIIESGGCKLGGGYFLRHHGISSSFMFPLEPLELLYGIHGGYYARC